MFELLSTALPIELSRTGVTVDFEMRNNNRPIDALDNDTGEFKKGNIERTVSRASGEQVEPPIEAERKNKTQHQKQSHTCLRLHK